MERSRVSDFDLSFQFIGSIEERRIVRVIVCLGRKQKGFVRVVGNNRHSVGTVVLVQCLWRTGTWRKVVFMHPKSKSSRFGVEGFKHSGEQVLLHWVVFCSDQPVVYSRSLTRIRGAGALSGLLLLALAPLTCSLSRTVLRRCIRRGM